MVFDNYEVGYCKPPKHTRFKKGQSGNPKGRRKGSFNLRTIFEKALREKVRIKEKGKHKVARKWDVAMRQLVNRAVGGDLAAIRLIFSHGLNLLESPSAADLRELAEFRETKWWYHNATDEELEARKRELAEAKEALERQRVRQEHIRTRKNKEGNDLC